MYYEGRDLAQSSLEHAWKKDPWPSLSPRPREARVWGAHGEGSPEGLGETGSPAGGSGAGGEEFDERRGGGWNWGGIGMGEGVVECCGLLWFGWVNRGGRSSRRDGVGKGTRTGGEPVEEGGGGGTRRCRTGRRWRRRGDEGWVDLAAAMAMAVPCG